MDRPMDAWKMDGWTDRLIGGWMDELMDRPVDAWKMDGWIDR